MGRQVKRALAIVLLAALAAVLFLTLDLGAAAPAALRDYLFERGSEETGSINLVSAIYLGYRVFDTLGETVVMLVSVMGVAAVLGEHG